MDILQVKTRAIYMGDGTFREETVRRPIGKAITKGMLSTATNVHAKRQLVLCADRRRRPGSQHGRVCNYPAARMCYANAKTAERGATSFHALRRQTRELNLTLGSLLWHQHDGDLYRNIAN